MKTTMDIADDLLVRAKETARREKRPLRDLVEEAIRDVLVKRAKPRKKFKLKDCSVKGSGLQPGVDPSNWGQIREWIYEGRGS